MRIQDSIESLLYPPLGRLLGIGNGLKDARRGRGNEDLRHDHVIIWGDECCRHSVSRFAGFAGFNKAFQPVQGYPPAHMVAVGLLKVASKPGMTHTQQSARSYLVRAAAVQAANL